MPDLSSALGFNEQKLPRRGKAKTLKMVRQRVENAKATRDQEGQLDTWQRLRDIYRLQMFDAFEERDRIAVAIGFATINVIAPSVAVNYPKIVVWPTLEDVDHQAKATIAEGVLNYWWRRYRWKKPIREAVKDSLIYGTGICKIGWRYEEREVPRDEDDLAADLAERSANLDEYAAANPAEAGDLPSDDELMDLVPDMDTAVIQDRAFVERVSPLDILVDPEATDPENLRWIAQKVIRDLAEVRVDERYKVSARRKVKADATIERDKDSADTWRRSTQAVDIVEDTDRIVIWEFYDLVRKEMMVFASTGEQFLIDPTPIEYASGHPYEFLFNYEVPDQFWSLGDLEAIEPLQNELNETRSQMVTARDLDIPKFFYRRDGLEPDAIAALRSKIPWTGVPVDGDTPFNELIAEVPRPTASPQLYQHSDQITNDVDLVTGVSEYQRGELPETRRTATEASIIQDAANARASDKLAQVEDFISAVAKRVLQLAQAYMTGEQAARATGKANAQVLWTFSADDIEGEFDFEVEAGSTQPRNETFRRQQAQQMANTLAPFVEMGLINPYALVTHLLTDGYGIKDPTQWLLDPSMMAPPPGAEGEPTEGAPAEEGAPDEEQEPGQPGGAFAQLEGQVGLNLNTLGGGAQGPGAPMQP